MDSGNKALADLIDAVNGYLKVLDAFKDVNKNITVTHKRDHMRHVLNRVSTQEVRSELTLKLESYRPKFMSTGDMASVCEVSPQTIMNWCSKKMLAFERVGIGKRRILTLDAFLFLGKYVPNTYPNIESVYKKLGDVRYAKSLRRQKVDWFKTETSM